MTTQQMAEDTLSRRAFCALVGVGAFALGLGLAGCGQDVADDEASSAAEPDEADEEAYETWADAHEELEDLIDEVRDRLEE